MTTKQQRDKLLQVCAEPLPNENTTFKNIREGIFRILQILCKDIDELEARLKESQRHKSPKRKQAKASSWRGIN